MTFDEWWKAGTSTKVPLYGEANAKKAWDYQQKRIEALEEQLKLLNEEYEKTWEVLRTYNPIDIELEYIGFAGVEDA